MRRRVADIAIITFAALLGGLLAGCGFEYNLTGADDDVESALISLTETYSQKLGVNVRGEIVTNLSKAQEAAHPAGFYSRGIAYYYRPAVKNSVTLVDGQCPNAPACELASGVAAHEVCHAKFKFHDQQHWCCMKNLGVRPTFPSPTLIGGREPTCEGMGR